MIATILAITLCISLFGVPPEARAEAPRTIVLRFEDLEGAVLLPIALRGPARDTSGLALLDTGAGYIALERIVAERLGLAPAGGGGSAAIEVLDGALPGASIGPFEFENESPVLQLDLAPFRRVTDRPLVALLGQHPFRDRALVIDYRRQELVVVTPVDPRGLAAIADPVGASRRLLGKWLGRGARPAPFRMLGDGKILLRGAISGSVDTLNWIVDTGATKTILFSRGWLAAERDAESWPTLAGLHAPTVLGDAEARIVRVPELAVFGAGRRLAARRVDCARLGGQLEGALSRTVGAPVHGLLGYSFLRRFRIAVDYVNAVMWLEPVRVAQDSRPYEYSTIGVQLERSEDGLRILAVANDSPAAAAGLRSGDLIRSIGDQSAAEFSLTQAGRMFEGRPGTAVVLEVERDGAALRFRIARRRLL